MALPTQYTFFSPPIGDVLFNNAALLAILNGTPGTVSFGDTTVTALHLGTGTKTATAVAGAATLNKPGGTITTEALTTVAGGTYVLTLTNSTIALADQAFASVQFGSSTTGAPCVTSTDNSAGQVVITIQNVHATAAFNGTLLISFAVFKN